MTSHQVVCLQSIFLRPLRHSQIEDIWASSMTAISANVINGHNAMTRKRTTELVDDYQNHVTRYGYCSIVDCRKIGQHLELSVKGCCNYAELYVAMLPENRGNAVFSMDEYVRKARSGIPPEGHTQNDLRSNNLARERNKMAMWWQGFAEVTRNCLLLSTIKGVNRYFKTEYTFLKVWWLVSIWLLFALAVVQVREAFREYYSHDTTIKLRTSGLGDTGAMLPITFPTSTLCNMKPVHGTKQEEELVDYFVQLNKNISDMINQSKDTISDTYTFSELTKASAFFQFLGTEKAKKYGQPHENFLIDCVVTTDVPGLSYKCADVAIVSTVQIATYFSCVHIRITREVFEAIRPRKISAILHLNDDDSFIVPGTKVLESDVQESGAIVTLSSQSQIPDDTYESIRIQPGTNNVINMALSLRMRLENPYGDCIRDPASNMSFAYTSSVIPYTKQSCEEACRQNEITRACRCFSAATRAVFDQNQTQDMFCGGAYSTFDERFKTLRCSIEATKAVERKCSSVCPWECEELLVDTSISSSIWPRDAQQVSFYNAYIEGKSFAGRYDAYRDIRNEYLNTRNASAALHKLRKETAIPRTFAKVELTLSKLEVSVISDEIKMSELDFVTTLASLMNMYSGITLIVVVECFDYIFSLILYFFFPKNVVDDKPPRQPTSQVVTSIDL
ncbi:hypothetical protein CAPTEDRAFT_205559 [Capitella teleta]|uniref:Amiloride-sensitive sodium channel n=1 Tax=Capitella teleta TaxID=283909 RepID=R7TX10_CAPTE|nr:hypothetical protein CAPTEDRAFT_205559 [Capitella teleta]|eukprot:ELT98448.1 hypothetical protein CAPTEDRAFT_205559 [Capitella teleta]